MLPPVCCLLLLPALAEDSRWMQQLFETALRSLVTVTKEDMQGYGGSR